MPFEVVQYPDTSPETSGTEVTVHWSRNGHVQLEVVRHVWGHVCSNGCDGVTTSCSECPMGTTAEFDKGKDFGAPAIVGTVRTNLRAAQTEISAGEAKALELAEELSLASSSGHAQILTEVLSRQEINKLIRVLRRARDQAYGEDA